MPYISTESVGLIRARLKAELPDWRFSVRRDGCIGVDVAIMAGPIAMTDEQVNHHWIGNDDYCLRNGYTGERLEVLRKVVDILTSNQRQVDDHPDYGSIPNYYVHLSVGRFGKPYRRR